MHPTTVQVGLGLGLPQWSSQGAEQGEAGVMVRGLTATTGRWRLGGHKKASGEVRISTMVFIMVNKVDCCAVHPQ